MLFDLAMAREYSKTKHPEFARATLVAVGLNILIQLFFVITQNAKRGKRVILREALFVVTLSSRA